jgi:ribonucleotide monophosphatase NagD (HAD superfamily)
MTKTYCFDIDGTFVETDGNDYPNSQPIPENIARINELYDEGHTIKLFTSRGSSSGEDWRKLTEKQMRKWGVRYHQLIFGKPSADFFVDDRAINSKEFFGG